MRTLRSKRLRATLHRVADGKCQICGCELGSDWQADHIVAWANGGETDVANMQAVCAMCNRKKGVGMKLREWQKRAFRQVGRSRDDFFLEATPGAGKTKFSCFVAQEKMTAGDCEKLIIVAPTTSLKEQWTDDLHAVEIDAEPYFESGAWPAGFQAICVTYQQVARDWATFRHFCARHRVMVILDEIHHCGEDASWGQAIKNAFEKAKFRLSLSGTPFRSDSNAIPFLNYVDGKAVPDFLYGYGEGMNDGICRHVFFPKFGGRMEWSTPRGNVLNKTFDDELPESETNQRLRTALTTGEWLRTTLRSANDRLTEMRETDDDAAGLIIAIDRYHARKIARDLATSFGIEADVVLSDDLDAQTKIKQFRKSKRPWLVAVKMVSEGVDIPRLRVGVYATNTTTEMFFRQAVGRFVRVESDHDDPTAAVFIPDDPRLRAFAEEIRKQRTHALSQDIEKEKRRTETETDEDNHDASYFLPLNSTGEDKGTIVDDITLTAEEIVIATGFAAGQCKPEIAAAILKRSGFFDKQSVPPAPPEKPERKTDKRKRLRGLASKLVNQICYATGQTQQELHYALNCSASITSTQNASVEQLERKLRLAQESLAGLGNQNAVKQ